MPKSRGNLHIHAPGNVVARAVTRAQHDCACGLRRPAAATSSREASYLKLASCHVSHICIGAAASRPGILQAIINARIRKTVLCILHRA